MTLYPRNVTGGSSLVKMLKRVCLVWCSSSLELVGELAHRGSRRFRRDIDLGKF